VAGRERDDAGFMTTITFITGANKGLGYETARRLAELGHHVIIGARDPERGQAAAGRLGVRFVPIDVTDDASVKTAAADIEAHEGRIDTLINNAGITGRHAPAGDLTGEDAEHVFATNVTGIVRVTSAFLPLLGKSPAPAVINVSSGMGSQALTHDPQRVESTIAAPLYTASKAAATMLTTQYAKALPGIRFNAADPGYTATDLNGHSGPQTVTEGTDAIVTLATEDPAAGTGRFIDRFGPVAW
jgi:NAD(P)-dependent dehydrogenase (short-subunit alcohol dehydrogenase family)